MQLFFPTKIRRGPKSDRKCHDCLCILIFSAFIVGLLFFAATATASGNISRIGLPMDSSSNICGINAAKEFKFLFVPQSTKATVCLKECPAEENGITDCLANKQLDACPPNAPTTLDPSGVCLPLNNQVLRGVVDKLVDERRNDFWTSIPLSYPQLLEGATIEVAAGVGLSFGMLLFPTAFLLVFYLAGIGLLLGLAIIFLYQEVNHKLPYLDVTVQEASFANIVCTVVFGVLALFMVGYLLARCNRLRHLSKFVNIGSAFLRSNFTALANSVLWSGFLLLFFYGWAIVLVCLVVDTESGPYTGFVPADWRQSAPLSLVVMAIALLWGRGTIISLSEFIISAQAIFWYCKKQSCFESYCNALRLTFRYHLGSVIFAGLTVANLPHRLLSWTRSRVQALNEKEDQKCQLASTLACCGCCYLLSDLSHLYHVEAVLSSQNFQNSSRIFLEEQQIFRSYANRGLYRMGVFASNALKLTLCTLCAASTYIFLALFQPAVVQGQQAVVALALGLAVGEGIADIMCHHLLGSGQVLLCCNLIDRIVEEKGYGAQSAYSCPQSIKEYLQVQMQ